MGDLMRPLPFGALLEWALAEYHVHGSIFGLGAAHLFVPA